VYTAVVERCGVVLSAGHTAIADAVFGQSGQRAAICACATAAIVPFSGIWLDAPAPVLVARVNTRSGDVSDADAHVVAGQVVESSPPEDWPHVDAARPLDRVVTDVQALVAAAKAAVCTTDGTAMVTR
jgi:predicted kinase